MNITYFSLTIIITAMLNKLKKLLINIKKKKDLQKMKIIIQ